MKSDDSSQSLTKVSTFQIAKDLQDIIQGKLNNVMKLAMQ